MHKSFGRPRFCFSIFPFISSGYICFLVSWMALSTIASCADSASPCTLLQTHKRAVLIQSSSLSSRCLDPSAGTQPCNSFFFDVHADPPTATLQRNQGSRHRLSTNFRRYRFITLGVGASIEKNSGILCVSLNLLPHWLLYDPFCKSPSWEVTRRLPSFRRLSMQKCRMTFGSFNVEDFNTVVNGVIDNPFPLLTNSSHAHTTTHRFSYWPLPWRRPRGPPRRS